MQGTPYENHRDGHVRRRSADGGSWGGPNGDRLLMVTGLLLGVTEISWNWAQGQLSPL